MSSESSFWCQNSPILIVWKHVLYFLQYPFFSSLFFICKASLTVIFEGVFLTFFLCNVYSLSDTSWIVVSWASIFLFHFFCQRFAEHIFEGFFWILFLCKISSDSSWIFVIFSSFSKLKIHHFSWSPTPIFWMEIQSNDVTNLATIF